MSWKLVSFFNSGENETGGSIKFLPVFTQIPQIENLSAPKQFSFDAIFKPFSCCCRRLCKRCAARFAIAILSRQINLLQFCRRDENQGPDLLAWENAVLLREERNCECTNPHSHTLLEIKKHTHTHTLGEVERSLLLCCVYYLYIALSFICMYQHTRCWSESWVCICTREP